MLRGASSTEPDLGRLARALMLYRDAEQELVARFPWIPWQQPQLVRTPDGEWLTCRFCTALDGLRAAELPEVGFREAADHVVHLMREHAI